MKLTSVKIEFSLKKEHTSKQRHNRLLLVQLQYQQQKKKAQEKLVKPQKVNLLRTKIWYRGSCRSEF